VKPSIALSLFSFFSFIAIDNYFPVQKEFEGTITYDVKVESKTPNISSEELQELYGTTMTKYFKDGNFKMVYNGKDINTIYFINKDNNEYDYRNGIDTLFVTSYDTAIRKLTSSTVGEGETILNRKCKSLIHQTDSTANYYWYDPSLYINPKNFEKSLYSFTDVYFEQAKSPWLKFKYDGENLRITYTAVKIKEENLKDNIFTLPNLPLAYYRD
jgi:hypothetical protein